MLASTFAGLYVLAALASWLGGAKYVHREEEEASDGGKALGGAPAE